MSPEKNIEKPKLNRNQLQGHGIEFIEKVHKIDELDSWLQPIGRTITRLQEDFPKAARKTFKEELERFHLCGQDRDDARKNNWCLKPAKNPDHRQRENHTITEVQVDHLKLANCELALVDVRLCRERNENEKKWTQILCEHVFLDFYKANRGSNSYE